ncbi:hypothetical protein J437_LFUL010967 [Ladona fulva]|uniref:Ig-like domain-containing protein n=1 Tax=Ladona fulva TaxID=123851 RepID=A0A8K0KC27_LADFU|nr:hypothetical protein J437_LFUL010967 [Ladona fulva]
MLSRNLSRIVLFDNEKMRVIKMIYHDYSVKTDLMEEGANSTLSVARADKADSGNYTCSITPTEFSTVAVHVLNGKPISTT